MPWDRFNPRAQLLEKVISRDVHSAFLLPGRKHEHRQRARYGLFKYGPAEIMGKEGGHRPHPWATLAIVFGVLHGNGLTLIKLQQQRECIDWEFQMQLEYLLLLNGRDL